MARIPTLQSPAQLQTGTQTLQTAQLPAVTNASIGKALGDVSSVAFDISEKAKRANDVTHLTNASLEMQKAQLEFATFQQNEPDESKWIPKWQELTTQIEGNVSKMPLTPDARAQLTERFSRWSTNGTIAVQAQGFKQAGVRMDASVELAKRAAVESGDPTIARQALETRRAAGFGMKETDDVEYSQVLDSVKAKKIASLRQQKDTLIQNANAGVKGAWVKVADVNDQLHKLGALDQANYALAGKMVIQGQLVTDIKNKITGNDGSPVDLEMARKMVKQYDADILPTEEKERLEIEINQAEKQYGNEDILKGMDDVANGRITAGNQFNSQWLRPSLLAEVRAEIDKAIPPKPEEEAEMYLGAMKAISELNPELVKRNDPAEAVEFVKVAAAINRSPSHIRNRLADALTKQLSGNEDNSANGVAMRLARSTLDDILQSKKGDYFKQDGNKSVIKTEKVGGWIKEQARIMQMENEFEQRIKAIPNPSESDFIKVLNDVMGKDISSSRKRAYLPSSSSGSTAFPMINPILFGSD